MSQSDDNSTILDLPATMARVQRFSAAQARSRGWQRQLGPARRTIVPLDFGAQLTRRLAGFGESGAWTPRAAGHFGVGASERRGGELTYAVGRPLQRSSAPISFRPAVPSVPLG